MIIKILFVIVFTFLIHFLANGVTCLEEHQIGFQQRDYDEGRAIPDTAYCWEILPPSPGYHGGENYFQWNVDYWERFDSLRDIVVYHSFAYFDLQRIFRLGSFPNLMRISLSNYCGISARAGDIPSEVFDHGDLEYFHSEKSNFKKFPNNFYSHENLIEIFVFDNAYFNSFNNKNFSRLESVEDVLLINTGLKYIPEYLTKTKTLEIFEVLKNNKLPEIPDLIFPPNHSIQNVRIEWDFGNEGCLDTLPVIARESEGSGYEEVFDHVSCFRYMPEDEEYRKHVSSARLDVTNLKELPQGSAYYENLKALTLINPHRISNLDQLLNNDNISRIQFYPTYFSLLPEDLENLLKISKDLKQLERISLSGKMPEEITEETYEILEELDFIDMFTMPDHPEKEQIRKHLPDNVEFR